MTLPPLTREQVRSIDQEANHYGLSGVVLMENAGRGCAETLCSFGIQGDVVIACGKGNNGGDGFVMARHLDALGFHVHIIWLPDSDAVQPSKGFSDDAFQNLLIIQRCSRAHFHSILENQDLTSLEKTITGADWIVDALLGTGAVGHPRPRIAAIIDCLNASIARKLAIDLPSGLDCDTGIPGNPTFRADHTCTFVAPKIGFSNPAAKEFLGTVSVHDIGVPRKLMEEFLPS